ncbi:MAG: histidine phosphatase family protein [Flavobacteriales bacterium]|nr:histidine phosphatase family protein [Flavobacteriales bacterium]
MRTLYITRHAKSSWDDPRIDDFDRVLNERGLRDSPFMAKTFGARADGVDLLVSSPAVRAKTTATFFHDMSGLELPPIQEIPAIYLASLHTLLSVVNRLPDSAARIMLFGHNPGLSELTAYLTNSAIGELPTCATVRIDLPVDHWSEVSGGLGDLIWYDYPGSHGELAKSARTS